MEKDILLNVDEFVVESDKMFESGEYDIHSLQQTFKDKIVNKAKEVNANTIVTNGNLASVLQDIAGYTIDPKNLPKFMEKGERFYEMGTIENLQIIIDINLKWVDNEINLVSRNDDVIFDLYNGIVIDTHGILI